MEVQRDIQVLKIFELVNQDSNNMLKPLEADRKIYMYAILVREVLGTQIKYHISQIFDL